MKQISLDKEEKLLNQQSDFLLNDFAFGAVRNSAEHVNEFSLFKGNAMKNQENLIKNDREEINLDELNALLSEVDGSKFEDKFSKMTSPPPSLALPKHQLMPSESKITAAPSVETLRERQ